jgi:hypothetical protein
VDGLVEGERVGERLMRQMMGFEIVPDHLNAIELGRVFGQPLDREPMGTSCKCGKRGIAGMDWTVVEDDDDRLGGRPGAGTLRSAPRLAQARAR